MRSIVMLLVLALALSGCAGDDDGDDGETTTSPTTQAPTTPPDDGQDFETMFLNGTVTGAADCDVPNDAGAAQGASHPIPPEAWNQTWELSKTDDPTGLGSLCLTWSDGTTGTSSGTVPPEADGVMVFATGGQIGYSLRIGEAGAA